MQKFILILTILLISGCQNKRLNITALPKAPTEGPAEYIEGWEAGCATGLSSYGSDYLRLRYNVSMQAEKMQDRRYSKGWEVGQRYCSYYISTYLSAKEFNESDKRMKNTWFTITATDDFFSYKSFDKFSW